MGLRTEHQNSDRLVMTVLKSFDEELVSDAGRWRTLEASAQLWLDSSCCIDDARWWHLSCKLRSRAKIGFITMNWWEFRSGGWKESEPAGVREYTSSSASYENSCFSLPHFHLSTCQFQTPYRRHYRSSDCNAVLYSSSNSNLQDRSSTSYAHNVLVQCTRTIRLHISIYLLGAAL